MGDQKKTEDDAAGMVLRLALKTRFSEMGWGSTPPSSTKFATLADMVIAGP